jgi:hypothetical protein
VNQRRSPRDANALRSSARERSSSGVVFRRATAPMAPFLLAFNRAVAAAPAAAEPQSGGLCETENEAELSELVLLMVCAFVITHPILAPHGCSSASVTRQRREYLKIEELLSDELVDAASTTIWRPVQLMLCTCFLALHKALISSAFSRIRSNRDRLFCRLNLEHSRVFVKHWSAQLIRPEEETRQAGDPT